MPDSMSSRKRFRVALSFAGEKRDFVAQVAALLAARFTEATILYDKYHEAEFGRRDLGFYLPDLYRDQSDLVVVVVCRDYQKEWCGLEWDAIFDLLKKRKNSEVLLCRFDHAMVQGLYSTAGFVELDDKTPEEATTRILERLAVNEGKPKDYYLSNAARSNLPLLPYAFFGRDDELKRIADSLALEARTWGALIHGPGGIGKTALAIHAAELTPASQFRRVIFLSSKPRELTPDGMRELDNFVLPAYLDMLNELARQIDRPDLIKSEERQRPAVLRHALQSEHALIIFDNVESLPKGDDGRLFDFLSRLPPGCKAIVTSRRTTDIDARVLQLERLSQPDALNFIARLAVDRPLLQKANDVERIALYENTGGIPLLIRWVAGQLGLGRCRTVADACKLLASVPADKDPLEFIFGDIADTFSSAEIQALAALSYFTLPTEVEFIAEVTGLAPIAAKTVLEDLAGRSLCTLGKPESHSFALMPQVAPFLRRKRRKAVREIGQRLSSCAYELVIENGYRNDRYPVLEDHWSVISAALPLFLDGPNERLQTVCDALVHFLDSSGRWDEWLSLELKAEDRAVAEQDFQNAGWRAEHAGWSFYLRGDTEKVLACAEPGRGALEEGTGQRPRRRNRPPPSRHGPPSRQELP